MSIKVDFTPLFVCGCPRSGTTAMWSLLTAHQSIALGLERYHFIPHNSKLDWSLFEKERFFEIRNGDTFYNNLTVSPYYAQLQGYFHNTTLRGDKIPKLYERYGNVFEVFPNAKIIILFRNLVDVASSYNQRVKDVVDWPPSHNYVQAIADWNASLVETLKQRNLNKSILCIDYEDFFMRGKGIDRLLNFIGITDRCQMYDTYNELVLQAFNQVQANKTRNLSFVECKEVLLGGRFDLYKQIQDYTR